MEGLPKKKLRLEKIGEGPEGYPEYKRVRNEEDGLNDTDQTSKFRVVEETPHGPVLERITDDDIESANENWLTESQRKQLRAFLFSLGMALVPSEDGDFSKRQFDSGESEKSVDSSGYIDREEREVLLDQLALEIESLKGQISEEDINQTMRYADQLMNIEGNYTVRQYIEENIKFEPWNEEEGTGIPPAIEYELRAILPGLCAQESRFDNSRVSKEGAIGVMQIMPEVWEEFGGQPEEATSIVRQVEIAGEFISKLYYRLNSHLGKETIDLLKTKFPDEESFQREFMVPLIINSYNAGAKRLADGVLAYLDSVDKENLPIGRDLYVAIADYAFASDEGHLDGYREQSRSYTPLVYAMADKLNRHT